MFSMFFFRGTITKPCVSWPTTIGNNNKKTCCEDVRETSKWCFLANLHEVLLVQQNEVLLEFTICNELVSSSKYLISLWIHAQWYLEIKWQYANHVFIHAWSRNDLYFESHPPPQNKAFPTKTRVIWFPVVLCFVVFQSNAARYSGNNVIFHTNGISALCTSQGKHRSQDLH